MRKTIMTASIALLVGLSPSTTWAKDKGLSAEITKTQQDMKKTLGVIPNFIYGFSQEALPGAWQDFKGLILNDKTALPSQTKNLIALGVDAQTPCRNCTYWDVEASKINGVTEQQRNEAMAMSAITRRWSTVLNGQMQDTAAFRREADQIIAFVKGKMAASKQQAGEAGPMGTMGTAAVPPPAPMILTPDEAYRDIEQTLGLVPTFLRTYPKEAIVGAWREMKEVQFSANTAIPAKEKELIGLGVAAQIPCNYCTYFHTAAARLNGANDLEISEAIAVAATTRHWSTVLNGIMPDEARFRRETTQIMRHMKQSMPQPRQMGGMAADAE